MSTPVNQTRSADVDGRWRRLLGGLWPARCLACAEPGRPGRDLCAACFDTLPWNRQACARCAIPLPAVAGAGPQACGACLRKPPPVQATRAAFVYAAPLDRLLPQLMVQAFADAERPQALLPVPLHRARLRERGYDQALELAKPLARALRLPLLPDALRRTRATVPQSRLDATHRKRNLRGA